MGIREPSRKLLLFWWLVFITLLLVAIWLLPQLNWFKQNAQINQPGLYAVDHFIDGDTIAVNMNGTIETIRMIGIDTPETHKPNTPVQCYGPQAADYTKTFIARNKVRLQADPLNTNRDRYGRLLRYVYLSNGKLVETELINNGYAFAYTQFPFEKTDEFKADEQAAKQAGKGLWGACQVTVEENGREQTNAAQQ